MVHKVELLDQLGARPATLRKTLRWNDTLTCTARMLITEHVRAVHDEFMVWRDGGMADIVEAAVYGHPYSDFEGVSLERLLADAIAAFETHRIIMIANDRQIETLDDEVSLDSDLRVLFVKIVPLEGG